MSKMFLRFAIALLSCLGGALLMEGACSVSQAWTAAGTPPVALESQHCEYDPELGWVNLPDFTAKNIYGPGVHLQTNTQRLRATRNYEPKKPAEVYRIIGLGDSFTMGYGVGDADTYAAQMEQSTSGLEVINMGLGGYGVGQCYLWYLRDGIQFECDTLLLAVIGNDFARMLPKGAVADQPSPLLELIDGEPTVINLPVPFALDKPSLFMRVGKAWPRLALGSWSNKRARTRRGSSKEPPVPVSESAFVPVAERILERLRDLSAERGQRFVVAYLPTAAELGGARPALLKEWLEPSLAEREIPLIDLWPAFKALTPSERQVNFVLGHYSSLGNRLASDELLKGLRALDARLPR